MFIIDFILNVIGFTVGFKNTFMAQLICDHPLTEEESAAIVASSIQETFGIIDGVLNVFGINVNVIEEG